MNVRGRERERKRQSDQKPILIFAVPFVPESGAGGSANGVPHFFVATKREEEEWVPSGGRRRSRREKKKSSAKVRLLFCHQGMHFSIHFNSNRKHSTKIYVGYFCLNFHSAHVFCMQMSTAGIFH